MEINFCRRCGSPAAQSHPSGYTCLNEHTIYLNPIPTSSLFLLSEDKTKITLAIRASDPGKGMLDAFGGFLEINETAESGLYRELEEEIGLLPEQIGDLHYITTSTSIYTQSGESRNLLSVSYWATLPNGTTLKPNDDVADVTEYEINAVPMAAIAADDNRDAYQTLLRQMKLTHKGNV